ncbi:MAG: cytochrome P450 [Gammaproteobacteria bacterium]|nr:cytochrome P450 [Gammaproteobacteria bacterium]
MSKSTVVQASSSVPATAVTPYRRSLPLLGDTLGFLARADRYLMETHQRHGNVVNVSLFGRRWTMLFGADANQFVYQNRGEQFTTAIWEFFFGPFFRRGLLMLDFDEHRLHRSIMAGAFRKEALERYLPLVHERIHAELGAWPGGDAVVAYPLLKRMTLNVGSEVFLGEPPSPQAARVNHALIDMVRAPTGLVRKPLPGTRWRAGAAGRRVMEAYFRELLPRKRAQADGDDLFAQLCRARGEQGEPLSDDDIINHVILILMAAHDTATSTLATLLYQLARYPEWQERLRAQALAGDARPDYAALQGMQELNWVMHECMRLCPPLPIDPRGVHKSCEFEGHRLQVGQGVLLSPWVSHRLPAHWREPDTFDPERFAPDRAEQRSHPFAFVPFGGGAHKCIGMLFGEMEIKAAMHQLLRRFRWSLLDGYRMETSFLSIPIPKDGLPLDISAL